MVKIPKYVQKKLAWFVVSVFIAITVNFFIPRLMPGSPIDAIMGRLSQHGAGGQAIAENFAKKFGLDKDLGTQFISYLTNLLQGDLGPSLAYYPRPVTDILLARLPWTIGLLGIAAIISWTLGNILGAIIGWSRESKLNKSILVTTMCMNQIPYYILAIILVYTLAFMLNLFPISGGYSSKYIFIAAGSSPITLEYVLDVVWHSILPALSIVLVSTGGWLLNMRSLITSVMGSDYFLFAEVKGLRRNVILMRYAFRNALLPQMTGLGMSLGLMMSGSLVMERVFGYPGIGITFMDAIGLRDYNLLQGMFLVTTLAVLIVNLIIDLIYPLIDPRIRYEKEG